MCGPGFMVEVFRLRVCVLGEEAQHAVLGAQIHTRKKRV
jgi:hypothetical protein